MIKIQRLNLDNSWFLQINELRLLIDPWLEGTEVDFFSWFNTQWHRTKPLSFQDVPEFDAVLITQKYPDHFHKETLKKLQPQKVIAPSSIQKALKKILPEAEIVGMSKAEPELEFLGTTFTFLPTSRKIDPIYDAFMLESEGERVFLATHGFHPNTEQISFMKKGPGCEVLITPFNEYRLPALLGGTVSPGIENVKELVDILKPKHVFATHDEDKHATGLVSKFAKITWAKSEKELRQISWLADRYQNLNHYNQITLS
ncbi:MBL fold metallo-hydrolase [Algoriphagus sediminis]|uniref:MBL fold metallo-hydrolase n=1 Tax=Algoriphagus sediminis TaxID=3057113 RepID=A0ABT7YCQ5_9BACT|nr:MBL fold metallo-hydrolase [Algoriphagus sediminis]MDN3204307.1 MBL fold metallo-hydrolase [Algoriphagus sediminis]